MPLKTCVTPDMFSSNLWQHQSISGAELYRRRFSGSDQPALKQALEASAIKAVELLEKSIQDDSLFLLFEWNPASAELTVVVTDACKENDSPYMVLAEIPDLLEVATPDASAASIQFLLSDFLASYSPFFRYSLVAIFHSGSRNETSLL